MLMADIILKYNLLNKTARQEVNDFISFLLSKQKKNEKSSKSAYKKNILNVSTWTDSDLIIFQKNRNQFNQWKIQEW